MSEIRAAKRRGDYAAARELAQAAAADGAAAALIELAQLEETFGEWTQSVRTFTRAIDAAATDAERAEALGCMAIPQMLLQQFHPAIDSIERARVLAPNDGMVALQAAGVFAALGRLHDTERLIGVAERAAALAPPGRDHDELLYGVLSCSALLLRARGGFEEARVQARIGVDQAAELFGERSVEHAYAINALGNDCRILGRIDEAVGCFMRAQQILIAALGDAPHPDLSALRHQLAALTQ